MASFNKVILAGNLTRDPELRYTPKGMAVTGFSLAVNRKWKDDKGEIREEVTFVECQAWGRTAESIAQYMRKGSPLLVEGRLAMESWEDKQTGQKRSRMKVVVETSQFLSGKREEEERPQSQPARNKPATRPAPKAQEPEDEPPPPEDDDVPF